MQESIIQQVIAQLGLPEIDKVDPNLQDIPDRKSLTGLQKLTQAVVPAVLLGIANIVTDEPGAHEAAGSERLLSVQRIFPNRYEDIVQSIVRYAGATEQEVRSLMNQVAITTEFIIRDRIGEDLSLLKVRDYIIGEKHHIYFYLPPQLQMGTLMGDASQDDRTKKMEGPFSNIMHKIEDGLSKPE